MSMVKKAAIFGSALGLLMIATLGFAAQPAQPTACSAFTGGSQCRVVKSGRIPFCVCKYGAAGSITYPFKLQGHRPSPSGDILLITTFMGQTFSQLLCDGGFWGKWQNDHAWTCLTPAQEQQKKASEATMWRSTPAGAAVRTQCQTDWNNLKQVPGASMICGGVFAQAVQGLQTMPGAELEALPGRYCIVGTPSAYLKWKVGRMASSCVASPGLKMMSVTKICQNDVAWNVSNNCNACGGVSNKIGVACALGSFPLTVNSQGQCLAKVSDKYGHATYAWTPGNMNASCPTPTIIQTAAQKTAQKAAQEAAAQKLAQCKNDVAWNVQTGCNACGGVSKKLGFLCTEYSGFSPALNAQGQCVANVVSTYGSAAYVWTPGNMSACPTPAITKTAAQKAAQKAAAHTLAQCQSDLKSNVSNGCNACQGASNQLGMPCELGSFSPVVNEQGQCFTRMRNVYQNGAYIGHGAYLWTPGNINGTCQWVGAY